MLQKLIADVKFRAKFEVALQKQFPSVDANHSKPDFFTVMGPLQLGSRDHNFLKNLLYYELQLKECQKWKEHIENTKMAKFEVPSIKDRDFMMV